MIWFFANLFYGMNSSRKEKGKSILVKVMFVVSFLLCGSMECYAHVISLEGEMRFIFFHKENLEHRFKTLGHQNVVENYKML